MAVKLYKAGYEYARRLVASGHVVADERDDWSEHQPTAREENELIERHGMREYALWHLGVDDEIDASRKSHYKFPYGDFNKVHRCALLAAESRAGRYKYLDIEQAAHRLHSMIETVKA